MTYATTCDAKLICQHSSTTFVRSYKTRPKLQQVILAAIGVRCGLNHLPRLCLGLVGPFAGTAKTNVLPFRTANWTRCITASGVGRQIW